MPHLALRALLADLPVPSAETGGPVRFSAIPIPGYEPHRLARAPTGEPALLISAVSGTAHTGRPPPIRLENIWVQHEITCRVLAPDGGTEEAPFTVVQFSGGESHLRDYFLWVCGTLLASLGHQPTPSMVQKAVYGLVDLFRALSRAPRKSVQGLWAELLVIARSANPDVVTSAWHAAPEDRYDFHAGDSRLEVKSASGRTRRHRFSLEQLQPPGGTKLLVVSVLMENSAGGVSLRELLDRVHIRLATRPDLQGRIPNVVALTLGEALPQALNTRFDLELATATLAFYASDVVPTLSEPLPPQMSEVSFIVDLTGLIPTDPCSMVEELFAAACPTGQ